MDIVWIFQLAWTGISVKHKDFWFQLLIIPPAFPITLSNWAIVTFKAPNAMIFYRFLRGEDNNLILSQFTSSVFLLHAVLVNELLG